MLSTSAVSVVHIKSPQLIGMIFNITIRFNSIA